MAVYVVETYPVAESARPAHQALMEDIYTSLHAHRDELPELLSYRTFTAGADGSHTRFVEVFEFPDKEGRDRFFSKLEGPGWLRTLVDRFYEIVPEVTLETWTGFLPEEWVLP